MLAEFTPHSFCSLFVLVFEEEVYHLYIDKFAIMFLDKIPGVLKCVQCTTENDKNCEGKTEATLCPRHTYTHCAATKTVPLDLSKLY